MRPCPAPPMTAESARRITVQRRVGIGSRRMFATDDTSCTEEMNRAAHQSDERERATYESSNRCSGDRAVGSVDGERAGAIAGGAGLGAARIRDASAGSAAG